MRQLLRCEEGDGLEERIWQRHSSKLLRAVWVDKFFILEDKLWFAVGALTHELGREMLR